MKAKFYEYPYPINTSFIFQLKLAAAFALFIFIFLSFFQPFQLSLLKGNLLQLTAGFAMVTFIAMLFLNAFVPSLFTNYFDGSNWTVGKEVSYTLLNLWFIGLCNYLYFDFSYPSGFSWRRFWWFQFITIAVGIFPVTFYILIKERKSRLKYTKEAVSISCEIKKMFDNPRVHNDIVLLESSNKNENFSLNADQLYFIQAADNYVEVYFFDKSFQKRLLRNSLKAIEKNLLEYNYFFRCHKSFIVNLNKIKKLSGNAQGFKLHIEGIEDVVPVSRQNNQIIKKRIAKLHQE